MRTLARSGAAIGAAVALALVTTTSAYAGDDLVTDGDGTVPVTSSGLAYGALCVGASGAKTVAFAIKHAGGGQIFANGATVALSLVSPPAGVTGGSFGSITLPSNWTSSANGTLSNAASGVVTVATSAAKAYSGTLTFRATGAKDGGGTLTREDAVAFSATVASCDTTPPVLTLPASTTIEAAGPSGAAHTYAASATDAADGARPVTCSPASGSVFPIGATTVSCSAADTAGNTATGSFTVTVADTTGPALTLPSAQLLEAASAAGAPATFAASATDSVDGVRPVTCAPASGTTFALGTTAVQCTASDTRGNESTGSFDVTVRDTTAPSLSLPTGVDEEAASAAGAVAEFAASASDTVDADVPVDCDHDSGDVFPLGATLVTCTGTDDSGNTAQGSFTVNVGDTTAPAVNVPGPLSVEATGPDGAAVPYAVTAHDAVDGDLTPSCAPASGTTFGIATTSVHCSVTDGAGNEGTGSFDVTVTDHTPPALTLPADLSVEAASASGAAVAYAASALDVVDGAVAVDCDVPAGTFPLGVTEVSCTATDSRGNAAPGSFTVTVVDTTPPALTLPADLTAETASATGPAVTYAASAVDTVSGAVGVTCAPASGAVFALGATQVDCSAEDGAGNTSAGSFTVTVSDTTPPALHLPGGAVAEATSASGVAVTYAATATDAVSSVTPDCAPASGATFALGTTTVTCTATDGAGNASSGSFDVVVQDTTAPAVHVPADATVEATGPGGAAYAYSATATDAVSPVTPDCAPASGATFALGTTTVTCTATDGAGNTGSATFDVTVVDTTPPALTLPASFAVTAANANGASPAYTATAADAVSGSRPVTCAPASGAAFPIGATTVSCSASDSAGNAATGSFTVTVRYAFSGFLQPVNDTGHGNGTYESRFRLGSTIPLKFTLGTTGAASVAQAGSPVFSKAFRGGVCDSQTVAEPAQETASTAGTTYRWDATAQQYVYNFSTKGLAAGEWRVYAATADGARNYVDVCLTK